MIKQPLVIGSNGSIQQLQSGDKLNLNSIDMLESNVEYFINQSDGSDTNDGLTSDTAFATATKALSLISKNLNKYTASLQFIGDYTGRIYIESYTNGNLTVTGNGGKHTSTSNCFYLSNNTANVSFINTKLEATAQFGICLRAVNNIGAINLDIIVGSTTTLLTKATQFTNCPQIIIQSMTYTDSAYKVWHATYIEGSILYNIDNIDSDVATKTLFTSSVVNGLLINSSGQLTNTPGNTPILDNDYATKLYTDTGDSAINQKIVDAKILSGFIRSLPITNGIIELSPDGTIIYRINQNGVFSKLYNGLFGYNTSYETAAAARQIAIYPVGSTPVEYYVNGVKYTKNNIQIQTFTNNTSLHYAYIDSSGNLAVSDGFTPDYYATLPTVAVVYGNATVGNKIVFSDERHGVELNGFIRKYLNINEGTRYKSGFEIQGLSSGGLTFTQITSGKADAEDIEISTLAQSGAPFWYLSGTNWNSTNTNSTRLGYKESGNTYISYNQITNGDGALTEVTGTDFVCMHFMLTGDREFPIVKILGQNLYTTLSNARAGILDEINSLTLTGLPTPASLFIGSVIISRTGALQTLADGSLYLDLRRTKLSGSGASSLTNSLSDMSDVDIVSPSDNHVLAYEAATNKWKNKIPAGAVAPTIAKITSDLSTTETVVMQNITQMTFSLEAGSVYKIKAHLTFQSSSTTGYVFGFTAPSDSRPSCLFTAGTQTTTSANLTQLSSPASVTMAKIAVSASSVPAANSNSTSVIDGLIQTVTAGTLTLQYRSISGNTVTLKAGSIVVLERIQ